MEEPLDQQISTRLTKSLKEWYELEAKNNKRRFGDMIRIVLEEYAEAKGYTPPQA